MMAGVPAEEAMAAASVTSEPRRTRPARGPSKRGCDDTSRADVSRRSRRAPDGGSCGLRPAAVDIATTVAAFVLAFLVGAILMIVSDTEVRTTFTYFFARPGDALSAVGGQGRRRVRRAVTGAVGGWGPITETTAQAAPLICAGLGVGLAFRAGLFNIGAQGQAIWGAIFAAYVGFTLHLPPVLHLLVAILAGVLGGAVWGGIVGWLKARTGAHEVIVTIMLNYIAAGLLAFLLTTTAFQRPGRTDPISPMSTGTRPCPRSRAASCTSASSSPWWPRSPCGGFSTARRSASPSARSGPTRTPPRPPG